MTIEQLKELGKKFAQLEELKSVYECLQKKSRLLSLSCAYNSMIDPILYDILRKYEKLMIEDLKEEIKKRETELESLSILQLNKIV